MEKITAKEAYEKFVNSKDAYLKKFNYEEILEFIYGKIKEHCTENTGWAYCFLDESKSIYERKNIGNFKEEFKSAIEQNILKPLLKDGYLVYLNMDFNNPIIYISWSNEIEIAHGLASKKLKREDIEKLYIHLLEN